MLKVNNLTVYSHLNSSKKYLLRDVSFSLNKGDSLGIISKSGEGKSTLAKALLNIFDSGIHKENGLIEIDGVPFENKMRGRKISLMYQNPNSYLNPLMKVGKQIEEMLTYHFKLNKKEAKSRTLQLMEKVGLTDALKLYDYYPYEISGGMQQRICLCIAIITEPDILILDESTSYLDNASKQEILDLIKKFQQERKFTIIMISHDFKEIYSSCNKIAIMRKGELIEFGNKDEIILNPIHPYTVELLCNYLKFYTDIESFRCPLMNIEVEKCAPITMISETHFVRSWYLDKQALKINYPFNLNEIKEQTYENLRNK